MENKLSKNTVSFGLSFAIASVVNALLVVAKEKSSAVQDWMQKATGHHWITHVIIIIALFFLFGWLFARANRGDGVNLSAGGLIKIIVAGVLTGYFIIAGFYLIAG